MKLITSKQGWRAIAEKYVICPYEKRIVALWVTAQQTPARGIIAGLQNNNNRKKESGFSLNGRAFHLNPTDHYRVEELRSEAPSVGVAVTLKLVITQATGNPPEGEPFYIVTEESHKDREPPIYFYQRLHKLSGRAVSPDWAQWLWTAGFEPAQFIAASDSLPKLICPIVELEGEGMWAYRINPSERLWASVIRKHKGLVHRLTATPLNKLNYSMRTPERMKQIETDPRFPWWELRLSDDKESVQWWRKHTGEWELAGQTYVTSSLYERVSIAAARAGIEVEFIDRSN